LGIVRKEGIYNTIIYYAGVVLGYFTMVVLLPKVLSPEQYGLVRILFPFSSMLAFFYLLGMPNVILRFFPFLKNENKGHSGILFFAYSVALVGVVVSTLVFFLLKGPILAIYSKKALLFVQNYYFIFPLAIGSMLFEILNAYNRAQYKTNVAIFLNEVYIRLVIVAIATFYIFHFFDFHTFIILYVAAYFSTSILMFLYTWRNKTLLLKPNKEAFKPPILKQMLNYGLFNFFGGATGMLIDKIDLLFVGAYLGLADTGIYGVAVLMAASLALPAKALLQILFPLTAAAFKENDKAKISHLYQVSCNSQLLIGSFIFMMVWVNYDSFFGMVHPAFLLAKYPFLILALGRLFDMATGINGVLIVNSKHYRMDIIFTTLLVGLTLLNNALLIPVLGMVGAATSTAAALIIYNIIKYFFVWKKLRIQPYTLESVKILLTIAVIFLISLFLPETSHFIVNIIYKSIIIGLLFLISLLYLKFTPDIYNFVVLLYDRGRGYIVRGKR